MIKQLSFLLWLLTFALGATAVQAESGLRFEVLSHDFGQVVDGVSEAKYSFRYTNQGNQPLVIVDARTACTCTKVSYPKAPILSGTSGVIEVTYQPRRQPAGTFYKSIQVHTNQSAQPIILIIHGQVVR